MSSKDSKVKFSTADCKLSCGNFILAKNTPSSLLISRIEMFCFSLLLVHISSGSSVKSCHSLTELVISLVHGYSSSEHLVTITIHGSFKRALLFSFYKRA